MGTVALARTVALLLGICLVSIATPFRAQESSPSPSAGSVPESAALNPEQTSMLLPAPVTESAASSPSVTTGSSPPQPTSDMSTSPPPSELVSASPGPIIEQQQAAIAGSPTNQIEVVGASAAYNDFTTGFLRWAEQDLPRYNSPKVPEAPPLPPEYVDDVEYVASLRRGPYPDLVLKRPAQLDPAVTDPLQNGQIANLPPGPAYAGYLSSGVPVAAPAGPVRATG